VNYSVFDPLAGLLALIGVLAIVARLGRAVLRVGLTAAEETAAAGMAEASARRGDLTTLAERRSQALSLRRRRWLQLAAAGAWAALLLVPAFVEGGRLAYAAGAVLWLLPRTPLRRPAPPPADGTTAQ
jgi:hypothetical protein